MTAQTIFEQLGGHQFRVMTGANTFVGINDVAGQETGLMFRIPGRGFARDGINKIKIALNGMDLYDVTYWRIRGTSIKQISESLGLYADMLRADFEEKTGLRVSLGTMGRTVTA